MPTAGIEPAISSSLKVLLVMRFTTKPSGLSYSMRNFS